MTELLAAMEGSAFAVALRASFVAYPLVNALHILAIGAVVTSVLLLDIRILGGLGALSAEPFVALMRRIALTTFAVAVLSGVALFSIRARDYAANPAFLIKLVLIAAAMLNFLVMAAVSMKSSSPGRPRKAAAALSVLLWPSILVAGRFIGFLG